MYKRNIYKVLTSRTAESRRYIQVLSGPRQTGKTTLAQRAMAAIKISSHYATADEPALKDRTWIEQQWEVARMKTKSDGRRKKALLVLDEIQKITGWSETVKRLWDDDTANKLPLHVIVLGSSALPVQRGLTESLAGRIEVIPVTHWSFTEMQKAFGWNVDQYIFLVDTLVLLN